MTTKGSQQHGAAMEVSGVNTPTSFWLNIRTVISVAVWRNVLIILRRIKATNNYFGIQKIIKPCALAVIPEKLRQVTNFYKIPPPC
jgi:hypothetical protein